MTKAPATGRRHGVLNDSFLGPAIDTEGEDLVQAAWEADTAAKRANLARKALNADLDNIDAYVLLSYAAKTLGERIALLREGVRAGDHLWAPLMDDPEMEWWGFIGTRPYMRAMQELGLALQEAGDHDGARHLYEDLLQLNPNDNQGVRANLVEILMARPRIGDLKALVAKYPDDFLLDIVMARLWLGLRSKKANEAKLVAQVAECNAHVIGFLLNGVPDGIEMSPYGITVGGEDQAAEYVRDYASIWAKHRKELERLREHMNSA